MNTDDRRAPGAARIAFDGLVEVGGTLGPSFEAHAVNVSEEGMHLRTAYLPELGQQVTCRFVTAPNESVVGSGEVVWCRGADKGGEFGIRFTEMDAECVESLKRVCGFGGDVPGAQPGGKVRLYIEGLASPMRAKVRDARATAITVGSDLGFLQVGKHLDLEDAQTGTKRPASIDRVDVEVDPGSNVPQLVVTLRYADAASDNTSRTHAPSAPQTPGDDPALDDVPSRMQGALARQAARVGPAFERLADQVKTTIALLAKRRRFEEDVAPRRTTAPAPGGGLRASGRRVVRAEPAMDGAHPGSQGKAVRPTGRKAAIAAAVMLTAVAGAFAMKRAHHEVPAAQTPAPGDTAAAASPPSAPTNAGPAPSPTETTAAGETPSAAKLAPAQSPTMPPPAAPAANAPDEKVAANGPAPEEPATGAHPSDEKTHPHPAPFSNGPVHHGNVLRLKMDGPVESIEGAQQPTGFVVKLPGRRSLEAASPLAARDSRIATIKVANEKGGAELTVVFKESVPNYRVSARGDTLVVSLAPAGPLEAPVAKRSDRGANGEKHAAHTRDNGAHTRDTNPER